MDYEDLDHPALYLDLVERDGCTDAWGIIKHRREARRKNKRKGARRVRRAVRSYLNTGSRPRIRSMAAGDGWDIA